MWCDIGKYAFLHGNAVAQNHFIQILGYKLKQQTVRKLKKAYRGAMKSAGANAATHLPTKKNGQTNKNWQD